MVVVRVYYAPYCPHCRRLIAALDGIEFRKVKGAAKTPSWFYEGDTEDKYHTGIVVVPVQVSYDFEPTSNRLPSSYMSSKWLKEHASTDLQKELAEKGQLVDMLGGGAYPVVEIEYFDGGVKRVITITGAPSKENEKKYLDNLLKLILTVHEIEKKNDKLPVHYGVR